MTYEILKEKTILIKVQPIKFITLDIKTNLQYILWNYTLIS